MVHFICCKHRQSPSPEPPPIQLVDNSETRGRFTLSSHASTSSNSAEDGRRIQNIFASASQDKSTKEPANTDVNCLYSNNESEPSVRRKESVHRLHSMASKVRKTLSQDSDFSKRASEKELRSSTSEERIARRRELWKALHKRLRYDIHEDRASSDLLYDKDAVLIKTPKSSLGRCEGLTHISPLHLSRALQRSKALLHSSETYTDLNQEHEHAPSTAAALSRVLALRGSRLIEEPHEPSVTAAAVFSPKKERVKKYVFDDATTPRGASHSRSPSPSGRLDTARHSTSSYRLSRTDRVTTPFGDISGTALKNPLPQRLASKSEPVIRRERHEPFFEGRESSMLSKWSDSNSNQPALMILPGVYDTKTWPASEQWLRRNPKLHDEQVHERYRYNDRIGRKGSKVKYGHHYDPSVVENTFRGVSSKSDTPLPPAHQRDLFARARSHSEGIGPPSLPVNYDTDIPQRLANKPVLPSLSSSQLQGLKHRERSFISGDSSCAFSVRGQRQASDSSFRDADNSPDREDSNTCASSSAYPSVTESLPSSKHSSVLPINGLSGSLNKLSSSEWQERITSIPTSKMGSVNVDSLERQTPDFRFHSRKESLTNRELAATETRILPLPRAYTLPQTSRFSEDLHQVSEELVLSKPRRRRVVSLDGSRGWQSMINHLSEDNAPSAWERALRDHAKEDAAILKTRPGSESQHPLESKSCKSNKQMSSSQDSQEQACGSEWQEQHYPSRELWPEIQLETRFNPHSLPRQGGSLHHRPLVDPIPSSSSSQSAGMWARFPSHTRPERSTSPAGKSDNVYTRDFAHLTSNAALDAPPKVKLGTFQQDKKTKSKNMTFGGDILSNLSHLYKTKNYDLKRRVTNEARGHRSSISAGGLLEYPELEMFRSISPPLQSLLRSGTIPNIGRTDSLSAGRRTLGSDASVIASNTVPSMSQDAREWSASYEDCVFSAVKPASKSD